ncbi:PAS domain S-box protein [Pseudomonas fulva]|uniref:PAS domain S-box protein n=1 Tax=Pseudomonas fulva TaxID=47880 RepID=UPI0018A9D697|nr:PAS domain S-box protein [Pseudomonas fulva]MBF8674446.1 PAS domain S-box protein [Pseudomonas fulva]MBF8696965.1 PAS domain S-box protein [Pseudomonas fulva]
MITAQLLQSMVDASDDGIVVAEQEGDDTILIYVNAAFERLTGYSRDEILYQDCRFLQGNDRDQLGRARIRKALAEGRGCREVLRNYRKDGTAFWNELSITPLRHAADQRLYFIGIQRDVTRQVEMERKLAELRVRQKAGDQT